MTASGSKFFCGSSALLGHHPTVLLVPGLTGHRCFRGVGTLPHTLFQTWADVGSIHLTCLKSCLQALAGHISKCVLAGTLRVGLASMPAR